MSITGDQIQETIKQHPELKPFIPAMVGSAVVCELKRDWTLGEIVDHTLGACGQPGCEVCFERLQEAISSHERRFSHQSILSKFIRWD